MKKLFMVILCFLLVTELAMARKLGQALIDSLLAELPAAKRDTNQVQMLNGISFEYRNIDPARGIEFGEQGLKLATQLSYPKGIATANNMIGVNYSIQGNFSKALDHYFKSLKTAEQANLLKIQAGTLNNIGVIYTDLNEFDLALNYLKKALKINQTMENRSWQANNLINMGGLYQKLGKNELARDNYKEAKLLMEALNNKPGIALTLADLGSICGTLSEYSQSLKYLEQSISIYKEMEDVNGIALCESNLGALMTSIAEDPNQAFLQPAFGGSRKAALVKAKEHIGRAIEFDKELQDIDELSEDSKLMSEILQKIGDIEGAFEYYKIYSIYQDSIFNMEQDKKLTQTAMQYEFDKKEAATKAEQEKKDIRQRNIRNSILAGLFGALVFLLVVYRQRNKIKKEKQRSEELLLNILPKEVAEELKHKGEAEARLMDEVTVLFTDFKGFTQYSEKLTPQDLVKDIHECFSAFDNIMEKHGMEKIKTIGDSYMAAGGLPTPNKSHATDAVNAALDIAKIIEEGKAQKIAEGKPYFEIRIGIHTGQVVAGIVGVKKYSYDIWGDTVNTASRMESSGEAGKVNISGSTYELVKNEFTCLHRGKIKAKGKGEVDMYFAEKTN